MATMFVRHTISDYKAWRKAYDESRIRFADGATVMRSRPWQPDRFGKRGRSGEPIRFCFSCAHRLHGG